MSVVCSSLINDSFVTKTNQSFNATSIFQILLYEQDYSPLSAKFWSPLYLWSFLPGMILIVICAILIPTIVVCIYYPKYDKTQKRLKLQFLKVKKRLRDGHKIFRSELREQCIELLSQYINDVNIINMIMDYANIILDDQTLDKIMTSTIHNKPLNKQFLCYRLLLYILLITLFTVPYIFYYHFIVHINDSYKSYIETDCIAIDGSGKCKSHNKKTGNCNYYETLFEIDMTPICDRQTLELNKYQFVSKMQSDGASDLRNSCWINKNDFTVRMTTDNNRCCSCCKKQDRCGGCFCYCCLLLFGTLILVFSILVFLYFHNTFYIGYMITTIFDHDADDVMGDTNVLEGINMISSDAELTTWVNPLYQQ
eukprot:454120_1